MPSKHKWRCTGFVIRLSEFDSLWGHQKFVVRYGAGFITGAGSLPDVQEQEQIEESVETLACRPQFNMSQ